jgi:4-amino-4-deoxy-L-arabinose transferase-like glycosyltransferase
MFIILFFTILGFLSGLVLVMMKRKIKPGPLLSATFLSLLSAGIWKALKNYSNIKNKRRYF